MQAEAKNFSAFQRKEVVADIERIAKEISQERAQAACNKEMGAFLFEIGASAVEKRIEFWLGLPFLVGLFTFSWPLIQPRSISAWLAVFVVPFVSGFAMLLIKPVLMAKYYEPRFGATIEAKHRELRLKYPLAYGIEPAPNPPSSYSVSVTFGSEK